MEGANEPEGVPRIQADFIFDIWVGWLSGLGGNEESSQRSLQERHL